MEKVKLRFFEDRIEIFDILRSKISSYRKDEPPPPRDALRVADMADLRGKFIDYVAIDGPEITLELIDAEEKISRMLNGDDYV